MKTLIEELEELCNTCEKKADAFGSYQISYKLLRKIISRHAAKVEEPLACLADRKGLFIRAMLRVKGRSRGEWTIAIESPKEKDDGTKDRDFICDTYAECEAKARQYLNTLKDKGEKI